MKLLITDHGDSSVGLMPTTYEVDVPFEENSDKEILDMFKVQIQYRTFENYIKVVKAIAKKLL